MEKTCANHPESLALATCKACEKSVCLMCVQDEKEGTFCSSKCVQVFREVTDWVDTNPSATPPAVAEEAEPPPAQAAPSIFDSEAAPTTAQAEFEPLVTPGSKWKMIGSVCANHTDTPAVATCDRCDKTLCSMCLIETEAGTFCSNECANIQEPVPLPQAPVARPARPAPPPVAPHPASTRRRSPSKAPKVLALVVLLAALGTGGYFMMNGMGSTGPKVNPPVDPPPIGSRKDPVVTDPFKSDPIVKTDPTTNVKPETNPDPNPVKTDPKIDPKTDPKIDPKAVVRPVKPVKPEPPPLTRTDTPWLRDTVGNWYRIRTTMGSQETYVDCGLKAKDANRYVLSQQTSRQGQAEAPQELSLEPTAYFFKGEETLSIEGRSYLCEIREWNLGSGMVKSWVLIEGRHSGAVLKSIFSGGTISPRRTWDHTIKLGGRKFECLVVESDVDRNGKHEAVKSWYCASFPMGALRVEAQDRSTTLVDAGDDWSKRPPFPK